MKCFFIDSRSCVSNLYRNPNNYRSAIQPVQGCTACAKPYQSPFVFDLFQVGCNIQTGGKWSDGGDTKAFRCGFTAACKTYTKMKSASGNRFTCEEYCKASVKGALCLASWEADDPVGGYVRIGAV